MWPRMSHTLSPLNKLTPIKKKFIWTKVEQYAFDRIKRIVARDNLLMYTDFNEIFKVDTNDSAFQLGAVMIHKFKPVDFYSREITGAQHRYTVTERELLRILETLK